MTARGRPRVVYNPVDLTRFDRSRIDRSAMRVRLGLPDDAFVLGVVGQITPWKGQQEAVQVLARLRSMNRDARLLIVGEPKFVSAATRYDNRAYYAELERTIAAEGLSDRVRLLGERSDVPDLMGALDVMLVPSWEEPFGRVVIEAMALRLVVVATNVGGPSEIIHDGIDGIVLAPRETERWAETIADLIDSPQWRVRLGDAAAHRAADFALPRHVAAMRELYQEAARYRSTPGGWVPHSSDRFNRAGCQTGRASTPGGARTRLSAGHARGGASIRRDLRPVARCAGRDNPLRPCAVRTSPSRTRSSDIAASAPGSTTVHLQGAASADAVGGGASRRVRT